VAWLARAEAEWSRLQGETDPVPWKTALTAFGYGYPYEEARSRWRLAETLVATGRRDEPSLMSARPTPPPSSCARHLSRTRSKGWFAGPGSTSHWQRQPPLDQQASTR